MSAACDACLRRGALIAVLAGQIARMLRRPRGREPAILARSDAALIEALGGADRARVETGYERFDAGDARARIAAAGCEGVCRHSGHYPDLLRQLHDPPNPLYLRGGLDRLRTLTREPGVAIVGGREPSGYGLEVATEMGRALGAAGVTVISGLAIGIDGASHRGALRAGGAALAVLAGGPDYLYPRQHAGLYDEVVAHGAVVSELAPGTRPWAWSFPARNRIMAALATVVVVVEAREASGSLITADFATELGRDLVAVPGRVTARAAAGSNRLLTEGAGAVRDAEDVLDLVLGAARVRQPPPPDPPLEPPLRAVLDAVEDGDPLQPAGLRAGLSAGGLRAALGRLETLGLVRRDGLGGYERRLNGGRAT